MASELEAYVEQRWRPRCAGTCPSRCSATTAAGCTRTSRCGRPASRCSPATPGSMASSTGSTRASRSKEIDSLSPEELADAWIAYKRENEADHVRLRPVPLYYDG